MKKLLSISLVLLLITSCFAFVNVSAEEFTSADGAYSYTVDENNNATITEFKGSVAEVIIPSEIDGHTVTVIGAGAFQSLTVITSVRIPSSVKFVDQNAFGYLINLESVYFEDGTERIGRRAFRNCSALTSVRLPNTLKIIEHSAFVLCSKLTSITIPKSVEIISAVLYDSDVIKNEVGGAFSDSGLTSITFESGSNLKTIGKIAFNYCKLKEITVPASVETIEEGAFSHSLIESVKFEDNSNLKTIGTSAFAYCEKLTDISLPDSLVSIGQFAFESSGYYKDEANWEDDVLYIGKYLICGKEGATFGDYTVKEGTRLIADKAFWWADITKVTFPSSLEYIGHIAFEFSKLNEVVFNDGLETIGNRAFYSTKLTEVTIPSTVEFIGYSSFGNSSYLTSVTVLSKNVELGNLAFELVATDKTMTIYGYAGSTAQAFAEKYKDNGVEFVNIGSEHNYVSEITKQPTCTEAGIKTYTCSCGDSYTEEIPALGHKETIDKAKAATCTETGLTEGKHCSVCKEILVAQKVVPAYGHKEKVTKAAKATYFIKGYTGDKVCEVCGKIIKKGEEIAKLKLKSPVVKISGGKKKITVKYKKVSGSSGYQIKYKIGKKTVTKTYNSSKAATKVFNKLKKGKYTVQIRSFVKQGKNVAYSAWVKKTVNVKR